MNLTTKQILDLANAHLSLNGYQQVVDQNGKTTAVAIPYDLSPKARWNAAKNLSILKRLAEAHVDVVSSYNREAANFRRKQDKSADPKANAEAFQAELDRVNNLIRELSGSDNDIDGLLKIPAEGFNLKASPIPPETLATLMPLIDGEPKFEDPPPAK
jgi:hypothetical protein